jgi:hypothetical protein
VVCQLQQWLQADPMSTVWVTLDLVGIHVYDVPAVLQRTAGI